MGNMNHRFSSFEPVALDTVLDRFPVLRQEQPHVKTSAKYAHISTADVLRSLESQGLRVHGVHARKVRDLSRREHCRHVVRLRQDTVPANADSVPEVCLMNSHDGSSAFALFAGVFRFICANGVVCGDMFGAASIRHTGSRADVIESVNVGAARVVGSFGDIMARIDAYRSRTLSADEAHAFAERALAIRFPEATHVRPDQLLTARRSADVGDSLWSVFNRVQENAIRGGLKGIARDKNNRVRAMTTRAVNGVDSDMRINRQLFALADSYVNPPALLAA